MHQRIGATDISSKMGQHTRGTKFHTYFSSLRVRIISVVRIGCKQRLCGLRQRRGWVVQANMKSMRSRLRTRSVSAICAAEWLRLRRRAPRPKPLRKSRRSRRGPVFKTPSGAIAVPQGTNLVAPAGADKLTVKLSGVEIEGGLPNSKTSPTRYGQALGTHRRRLGNLCCSPGARSSLCSGGLCAGARAVCRNRRSKTETRCVSPCSTASSSASRRRTCRSAFSAASNACWPISSA